MLEQGMSPYAFTAYYVPSSTFCWFVVFLFFLAITIASVLFDYDKWFFILSLICAAFTFFFFFVYQVTYRCHVNDEGLTVRFYFLFKKQILWKDIKRVEIQTHRPVGRRFEKNILLRNKQNKVVFSCSYDLVGFQLIIEKAKIYREKKNLYR